MVGSLIRFLLFTRCEGSLNSLVRCAHSKAVGSKWILGGRGGGNSRNLGGSGGRHPQIILKSRTPEIRFPAFYEGIFYQKAHYKLDVWE